MKYRKIIKSILGAKLVIVTSLFCFFFDESCSNSISDLEARTSHTRLSKLKKYTKAVRLHKEKKLLKKYDNDTFADRSKEEVRLKEDFYEKVKKCTSVEPSGEDDCVVRSMEQNAIYQGKYSINTSNFTDNFLKIHEKITGYSKLCWTSDSFYGKGQIGRLPICTLSFILDSIEQNMQSERVCLPTRLDDPETLTENYKHNLKSHFAFLHAKTEKNEPFFNQKTHVEYKSDLHKEFIGYLRTSIEHNYPPLLEIGNFLGDKGSFHQTNMIAHGYYDDNNLTKEFNKYIELKNNQLKKLSNSKSSKIHDLDEKIILRDQLSNAVEKFIVADPSTGKELALYILEKGGNTLHMYNEENKALEFYGTLEGAIFYLPKTNT